MTIFHRPNNNHNHNNIHHHHSHDNNIRSAITATNHQHHHQQTTTTKAMGMTILLLFVLCLFQLHFIHQSTSNLNTTTMTLVGINDDNDNNNNAHTIPQPQQQQQNIQIQKRSLSSASSTTQDFVKKNKDSPQLQNQILTSTTTTAKKTKSDPTEYNEDNNNSNSFSNHNHNHNYTVAICAAIKDHEAYLMEWIDYHLIGLEFDVIYLYDNSDDYDLKSWYDNSRSHPIYSRVHIQHQPGKFHNATNQYMQKYIYNDCVKRYGQGKQGALQRNQNKIWSESPKHKYMAIFDTDEFIVFQKNQNQQQQQDLVTIHDLLDQYLVPYVNNDSNAGALAINWMYFGTSNHTIYAPIPVTKRFQYRDSEVSQVMKTIVVSDDYQNQINPHGVRLKGDKHYVDTMYPGSIANISKTVGSNYNKPSNVVLLYHYRFMSNKEYWSKRCERGAINGLYRGCLKGKISNKGVTEHAWPRPGEIYDDKAWQYLMERVPKYRVFDDNKLWIDFA